MKDLKTLSWVARRKGAAPVALIRAKSCERLLLAGFLDLDGDLVRLTPLGRQRLILEATDASRNPSPRPASAARA